MVHLLGKKEVLKKDAKNDEKRSRELCGDFDLRMWVPLKKKTTRHQDYKTPRQVDRTRPGVPNGTVADIIYNIV